MIKKRVLLFVVMSFILAVITACSSNPSIKAEQTEVETKKTVEQEANDRASDNPTNDKPVTQEKEETQMNNSNTANNSTTTLGTTNSTTASKKQSDNDKEAINLQADSNHIHIASGEEAIEYLKQQIEEGTNVDVTFGTDGILETDYKGSYYFVRLVSTSLRVSGGTGTLDTYKVYQDGTYETLSAK